MDDAVKAELPRHYPVSAPDVQRLNDLIQKHRETQRYYSGNCLGRNG